MVTHCYRYCPGRQDIAGAMWTGQAIWRYGLTMKHFHFFLLVSVVVGDAWAQPSFAQTAVDQTAPAQRRDQLRSVLKTHRGQEAQGKNFELESGLDRHLSAQERADLRKQLRQQQRDAKLGRP